MKDLLASIAALPATEYSILVSAAGQDEPMLLKLLRVLDAAGDEGKRIFFAPMSESRREEWEGVLAEAKVEYAPLDLAECVEAVRELLAGNGARVESLERKTAEKRRVTMDNRKVLMSGFASFGTDGITPQVEGVPQPPLQKPFPGDAQTVRLPPPDGGVARKRDIFEIFSDRKSRRTYSEEPLSKSELSWLLWACQGVRKTSRNGVVLRTVPSGGNRHPLETYVAALNVTGLEPALYRYLPVEHSLVRVSSAPDLGKELIDGACDQPYAGKCAVCFIWTAIPFRSEWRYMAEAAKLILQDSGHACQNLYLAAEAIGCGTAAIGAYDQEKMDALIGLDGKDELVVYMAPVGKVFKGD